MKGRGIRDAHLMSTFLLGQLEPSQPIQFLSSPATRALHTALIFAQNFGIPASEVEVVNGLYHCSTAELHTVLRDRDDRDDTLFIFGHNPGLTDYINQVASARIDHLPTSGVACLRFDAPRWSDLSNSAELLQFEYPKRLKN